MAEAHELWFNKVDDINVVEVWDDPIPGDEDQYVVNFDDLAVYLTAPGMWDLYRQLRDLKKTGRLTNPDKETE